MHNIVFIFINTVIVVFWFAYNKQFIDVGGSPCQQYPPFHVWVTKVPPQGGETFLKTKILHY